LHIAFCTEQHTTTTATTAIIITGKKAKELPWIQNKMGFFVFLRSHIRKTNESALAGGMGVKWFLGFCVPAALQKDK
jgi:hypothetical protein